MSGKLQGKVAVITGGSSGIGLATARQFVAEGAHVFISGRRPGELDKAKALIGKNVTAVQGDAAKLEDLDRLYETVAREKGGFDILVVNAAVAEQIPTAEATPEHFDRIFSVNTRGAFFTVQKAWKLLRNGGSVVLVASGAQYIGIPGMAAYSATKAALRSFARTWAAEFKDRAIRVNTLSPGAIETPMMTGLAKTPQEEEAVRAQFVAMTPLGRVGRPEEMAKAILFLASDDSSYTTGSDLVADGGTTQV
jgi:NAD(P)-dependent dehydrogenase (short-subunit alcohol dehydrogenase family)